jgi:hypothetical protein
LSAGGRHEAADDPTQDPVATAAMTQQRPETVGAHSAERAARRGALGWPGPEPDPNSALGWPGDLARRD